VEHGTTVVRTVGPVAVRRPTVVAGTAERFAERVEMRRRITRRRVIGGAVGVGIAGVLAWVLLWSPVLALDMAEVDLGGQGTVVDPTTVMAVVQPHDGEPLPRLDTVELRREILDVPGVRAAEVARVWPHGLRIAVVSREPVAAVPDGAGPTAGFVLLDVEGVQVGRAAEAPAGLPVISVPVDDEDALAMNAVLAVLQALPPELAVQVAAASADTQDTVRLVLADGAEVEWGSADRSALKARVLLTLRSAPASAGAAVFDVSAPTLPITRT
jgi:cell division protein FtsQ